MKHTNSQRGPDGLFARSDGPKAKRIEVWLQPEALSLLDTLCRQWSVGRGKAISHLLCHGPVAPAAWAEQEQPAAPAPTPSAPPAPEPPPADPVDPEPTPSGRFDFSPYTEPRDAKWEIHQADARAIGIKGVTGDTVRSFKAAHKLPQAQPLSPEALQLFRDEREAQARAQAGRTRHIEQVLQRLQERATPERISQLAGRFDGTTADVAISGMLLDLKVARVFLLEGLDAVGIRKRSKLVEGVWADLHNLIPSAVEGEQRVLDQWFVLPEDKIAARCMFWGAVIRLASNEGEAPASVEAFLEWCGYAAHQSHAQRKTNRMWDNFSRTMSGKPSSDSDRATLGLPPEAELTRKAINDAYKQLAKQHHPDADGGDADRFQRLVAARERLLLEVG